MIQGVRVWDIMSQMHLDEKWLRQDVLSVSRSRYTNLRTGHYLLTFDEATRIVHAFVDLGLTGNDIFDWDADILPRGLFKRPGNWQITTSKARSIPNATQEVAS